MCLCARKPKQKSVKKLDSINQQFDIIRMDELKDKMRKSNFKEDMIAKCLAEIRCSVVDDEIFLRREFNNWLSAWELARTYDRLNKKDGSVTVESLADALKELDITFILNDRILKKFEEILLDDVMVISPSSQIDNAMEIATKVKNLNEFHKAEHEDAEQEETDEEYWKMRMKEEDLIIRRKEKKDSKIVTMKDWIKRRVHGTEVVAK